MLHTVYISFKACSILLMLPKMLKFFTNNLRHFDMKFIMASSMHKILVSLVVPFFAQQTFAKSIYALVESFKMKKLIS